MTDRSVVRQRIIIKAADILDPANVLAGREAMGVSQAKMAEILRAMTGESIYQPTVSQWEKPDVESTVSLEVSAALNLLFWGQVNWEECFI
jgi:DNA-binding transcriptional regulator YiaG